MKEQERESAKQKPMNQKGEKTYRERERARERERETTQSKELPFLKVDILWQ